MNVSGEFPRRAFLGTAFRCAALGAASPLTTWLAGCDSPDDLVSHGIGALGTEVTVVVRTHTQRRARRAILRALREVAAVHQDFSLFRPSPLRTFNAEARQRSATVPDWLREVLVQAVELQRASHGLFNPWLRSFTSTPSLRGTHAPSRVEVDTQVSQVRLHGPGAGLDLNGLVKGVAVDRAAEILRTHGVRHFVINAGGDLLASGDDGSGEAGWPVRLAEGLSSTPFTVRLRDQAAATSGNVLRSGQRSVVHLVDPTSGRYVDPLRSATVIAPTTALADGWATALFVDLERASPLLTARPGLSGCAVERDGSIRVLEST